MPRAARAKSESGIYHVMLRGINRQTIFEDDEDCEKYLHCIADSKRMSGFTLYAYCLMVNHVHLLLKEGKEPLGQIFKRIGASYVYWYNWKYKRCGHLFQDRFRSEAVENDAYFLAVLRYIYQNPVKANLCVNPGEYRWNSYRGQGKFMPLVDRDHISEYLPIAQLCEFIETPAEEEFLDMIPDLRITDSEAVELIKEVCGINSLSRFQSLPPKKQTTDIIALHGKGCSIRQIARLAGMTKKRVEWTLHRGQGDGSPVPLR